METYTYGVYGELLSGEAGLTRFLYNGRCGVSTDDNGLYYMRQRYYNPEIKRFVNQDILAGSPGNSQSLNRYSYVQGNPVSYTDPFGLSPSGGLFSNTNFAHSFFGLLSCVPGIVGACASLADGLVYALVDKDYAMAGLCALDVVSMGLGKFATNLIKGQKMTNTGVALYRSAKLMSNVSSFGQNAIALNQNVGTILEKWDSGVSASGTDFLALGMSVFGCAISGGGILHDVGQIRQMRSDADFMKGLKSELGQFGNEIKTSFAEFAGSGGKNINLGNIKNGSGMKMNLQFFGGGSSKKSVNLPSSEKVKINMEEVLSGHTSNGKRAQQSQIKDLFPDRMNARDIEKEIRKAYGNAKQIGSPQFDGIDIRIKLQGNGRNGVVEMWYNKSSKTIETAYPIYGKKVKIE